MTYGGSSKRNKPDEPVHKGSQSIEDLVDDVNNEMSSEQGDEAKEEKNNFDSWKLKASH